MTVPNRYDLFIVGGGPGGYTAALLAAKKGLRVGLAEASHLGGTCTNTGCIPTKAYKESIELLMQIKSAHRFGIEVPAPLLSVPSLQKRKTRIVTRLVKGIELLLKNAGIAVFQGTAELTGKGTLRIGNQEIAYSSLIIATGARPKIPPLFDLPGIWTSDDIFSLLELPSSLLIIGGGVIGMEIAYIFSHLGAEVTVLEAMERILPSEDEEVSRELVSLYRKIRFVTSACVTDIERTPDFRVKAERSGQSETFSAQHLLLCIGRKPNIPTGAPEMGIRLTSAGGIETDGHMQTNLQGIYAVGDVTGEQMYAYVAAKEAEIAVDHITGGSRSIDYSHIPSVIFTGPEVASVGTGKDLSLLRKGTFPVSALGRARTIEASEGFATVYASVTGRIERVTIVAPHATELIAWATLAISQGLTLEEFLRPYYAHPTMAELVKEAAEDIRSMSIHKP